MRVDDLGELVEKAPSLTTKGRTPQALINALFFDGGLCTKDPSFVLSKRTKFGGGYIWFSSTMVHA
jgi:hypothetical protein